MKHLIELVFFVQGETTEKYIPPQRVAGGGIQLSDSMIAACQEREEEFSQQQAGHHIFPLDREVTPYYRRFFYKEGEVPHDLTQTKKKSP